eukprot:359937-Chlamydomonas_euryale.AAC.11
MIASFDSNQVSWGGEDAHFVSSAGGGAMGVADGVGGWHETGVNPAGVFVSSFLRPQACGESNTAQQDWLPMWP